MSKHVHQAMLGIDVKYLKDAYREKCQCGATRTWRKIYLMIDCGSGGMTWHISPWRKPRKKAGK